jgi:hypothetical protein
MLLSGAPAVAAGPTSVYTDLSGKSCSLAREDKETGATVHRCKGIAGWDLLVLYDDQRMSLTVVRPDGSEHPLDFWNLFASGSSSLGPRAEWRLPAGGGERREPVALIVRVNTTASSPRGLVGRKVSYLAVVQLHGPATCVTTRVPAGATANGRARRAADQASPGPCMKP